MDRSILHCDMNNFYASVERLFDASLLGKPVAVCGEKEMRHGIVLAKSEEAKRLGVKTGDPIWQAKMKCPELVVISPHFERYVKYSRLAKEIYLEYTDLVEPFGMDEAWLDVTASRLAFGEGVEIGNEIRRRIREELGLTISVGVSFNKLFAKLGSDLKKPDALSHIPRGEMERVVWPLPVGYLMGVGRKTEEVLRRFNITTIGDLARADSYFLQLQFGKIGAFLKDAANGKDRSPVLPADLYVPMKSVGHGLTVPKSLATPEEVWLLILTLTREIGEKLRFHQMRAGGVAIECKTDDLLTRSLQKTLSSPTNSTIALAREAFSLFRERYPFREPLRAVTVRAIQLVSDFQGVQLSLFTQSESLRQEVLDRASDAICRRWGKNAILNASLLSRPLPDSKEYVPFHAP